MTCQISKLTLIEGSASWIDAATAQQLSTVTSDGKGWPVSSNRVFKPISMFVISVNDPVWQRRLKLISLSDIINIHWLLTQDMSCPNSFITESQPPENGVRCSSDELTTFAFFAVWSRDKEAAISNRFMVNRSRQGQLKLNLKWSGRGVQTPPFLKRWPIVCKPRKWYHQK